MDNEAGINGPAGLGKEAEQRCCDVGDSEVVGSGSWFRSAVRPPV